MSLKLGDLVPDFEADSTIGKIDSFHKWIGDSWAVLFSHPADFTPVCTTELSQIASINRQLLVRGIKPIALSCDSVESHNRWIEDIKVYGQLDGPFPLPIIADEHRKLAILFGMLDPDEKDDKGRFYSAEISPSGIPLTCRAVFVVGPDKRLKLSILYPATTGRNFDELLRVIDSLQLTCRKKVATPVDWQPGHKCMIVPSVRPEEVSELFPDGFETIPVPSGKPYIRLTKQPE